MIGVHYGEGMLANDATGDRREFRHAIEAKLPPDDCQRVIGVTVVSKRRAPFHVSGWALCRSLICPGPPQVGHIRWTVVCSMPSSTSGPTRR